ncbi:YfhO family protein [Ruminococcus difficilis]|uniref:YfhO family protein n=1 Tax=Ruminococcus difficilis TaxID=2763069 RepID=A0A934WQ90_9FIRM|nr:YfhO family protein [Ruminococcus difficilis]MBK6087158.1 YfhO family protein [Ruminococcus difficilis]
MVLNRIDHDKQPYSLYAFLWAFLLSAVLIVPVMIYDQGYFLYYGDFNVQQIPFYQLAHDSIQNGEMGWSHLTDLGANFIGSYSFYVLGSPFFWLTVLLPSAWVPYCIGPLLMLKLGFASLSAYIYIRRYVRHKKFAVIGGVLYAFSGFSVYNIFFFHFHEAIIIFPLLLAALDEFHATKRKGVVALAVCAAALVNYYFFFGQVVFVIIYYVVKLISKSYRFHFREFFALAFECVAGFAMSMILLLPSVAAITGNYRVAEFLYGWDAVVYPKGQRYVQILVSLFFPGDVPAKNNFTPSAGAKWSSVAAYIPMFSMTYVIAHLRLKKRGFFRRMIIILLIMAGIPILNSTFQFLNNNYYARWFYMLTLLMVLVTVQSLDNFNIYEFKRGFIPTAVITLVITALIGLMPDETDKPIKSFHIGIAESPKRFWVFVIAAICGLALTLLIAFCYQKKRKWFFRITVIALSLFVATYSTMYMWSARSYADRDDEFMINYALNGGKDITIDDVKEVRSDFYQTSDNMGMFWQIPNIQAFHSIVPGSLMNFYNNVGVQRDVGSRPSTDHYGLRGLLSVKYLFEEDDPDAAATAYSTHMPGYRYLRTENGFDAYENEHYVPMGFTYDRFITKEEYDDLSKDVRHLALLKAMVLTQDQMEKYADITGYTDGMYLNLNFSHDPNKSQDVHYPKYEGFKSITGDFVYDETSYFADTEQLREHSCTSFRYTKDGFEAQFDNQGMDNLLFFSIPYEEGWTAYVNGEKTEVEEVDAGLMAVRVPGRQTSEIKFVYHTPLLKEGCIISGAAVVALAIYLIIFKGFRAKRKFRRTYRIKQNTKKMRRML